MTLAGAFDDRVDSLTAPGAAGGGGIARARYDLAATAQRLVLRNQMLVLADSLGVARGALLDLAEEHVFTLMQAWSGTVPLQPTNLAHFLTGTIAPLGRGARRLQAVYEDLDRSPLGAGALAGPGLPVDREETADLLGMEGPVESTFDAVSAVDHVVAAAQLAADTVAPLGRLWGELLIWRRTDPQAIRLADELLAPPDPNLPHLRQPVVLTRLIASANRVKASAEATSRATNALPYGPPGDFIDDTVSHAMDALTGAAAVAATSAALLSGSIEINRAWLARNAGRDLVTSGELADLLMAEEGLDPLSARNIAALTASRARDEGLEASGITPAMIDGGALLTIGRELGIEIERLGAYLAPRRFVEKRTLLGGPAPPAVRDYLAQERKRLGTDRAWLASKRNRIALAHENLEIRTHDILAAASSG